MAVTDANDQVYKVSQVREYSRDAPPKSKNVMDSSSKVIHAQLIGGGE